MPSVSDMASEIPTNLSVIGLRPVVSVSMAIIWSILDMKFSSSDILFIVLCLYLICLFSGSVPVCVAVSIVHAFPAKLSSGTGMVDEFSGKFLLIFSNKDLLSIVVFTKFNAPVVLNTNGVIFRPDRSTLSFKVTSCFDMYASSRLSCNNVRIRSFFTSDKLAYRFYSVPN